MGNTNFTNSTIHNQKDNWIKISSLGYCDLVYHPLTGTRGQRYFINIPNSKLKYYQYRKDNSRYLVGVHFISQHYTSHLCNNFDNSFVITERIPYRLVDFGQLSLPQGLYVLDKVLNGAKIIFQEIGGVKYDGSMICINEDGQAKIWLNENISKYQPQEPTIISQTQTIQEIFNIVQSRINDQQLECYINRKEQFNLNDFVSAIYFIHLIKNSISKISVNSISLPQSTPVNYLPLPIQQNRTHHSNDKKSLKSPISRKTKSKDISKYEGVSKVRHKAINPPNNNSTHQTESLINPEKIKSTNITSNQLHQTSKINLHENQYKTNINNNNMFNSYKNTIQCSTSTSPKSLNSSILFLKEPKIYINKHQVKYGTYNHYQRYINRLDTSFIKNKFQNNIKIRFQNHHPYNYGRKQIIFGRKTFSYFDNNIKNGLV